MPIGTTSALKNAVRCEWDSNQPDTVGEVGSSGGERGEAGGAGGGARDRPEPGGEALEVDRGRGGHVLQVGPGQPAVAAPAQAEGAHPLRDGALDPGPPRVGAPPLLGREPPPGRLERLVLRPRLQPEVPGLSRSGCTGTAPGRRRSPPRGTRPRRRPRRPSVDPAAPAEDGLPCGQRARSCSQSISKRSGVYPPSTLACQAGFGRGGPKRSMPELLAAARPAARRRRRPRPPGARPASGPCRPGRRGSRPCTAPRARWRPSSSRG